MNRMVVGMLILCLSMLVVFAGGTVAGEEVGTEEIPEELYEVEEEITLQSGESVTIDEQLSGESGTVDVVVRFSESLDTSSVEAMKQSATASQADIQTVGERVDGIELQNTFWIMNAAVVTVDTEKVSVEVLGHIDGVERLHANFEVEPTDATASPSQTVGASAENRISPTNYETTYGLEQIGATEVWDEHGTQGEGTIVTVLDTGIDPDHQDLVLSEWQEFDSNGNQINSNPYDSGDHGTHVSGTVAGGDASGEHIGVAPGTELHHGGVLTDNSGTFTAVAAGIEWGVDNNADVVTMSLGVDGGGYISTLVEPIYNAEQTGTVIIGSAGNEGDGATSTPGNTYDGISVGASNEDEGIRSSSSGEVIDTDDAWGSDALSHWPSEYVIPAVAAPGASVYSTEPGNSYGFKSGTSMAAPHVAGAAALMQSATTADVQPTEIKAALEETAWKPANWDEPDDERDTRYGSGIIDVPAAIDYLEGSEQVTVVDFNWPLDRGASCPSESVDDLDLYFSGDMSSSDDDFHIDDGSGGDESPPDGGCVLRSEGESATIDSTPGGQSSDLEYYPERGDAITFEQYAHNIRTGIGGGDGADFEFRFGVQDSSNYYYVRTEVDDPPFELVLGYVSGGTDITLDSTDIEDVLDDGTYQTVHIEWGTDDEPDRIEATYAGDETVSATSTLYDSGGIGFERVGTQGSVYSYTHLVDSVDATVLSPSFDVEITDYDEQVDPGETAEITAEVTNYGGLDYSQWVDLLVDGEAEDWSWVSLESGYYDNWDSTTETFELETDDDVYEVTPELCAMDAGNCDSVTISVGEEPEPDLQIQSIDAPDTIDIESPLEVDYTIENVGQETGEESYVDLLVDGTDDTYDDTDENVAVEPGETASGTLVFDDVAAFFDDGDTISYSVELWSFGDEASGQTTVTAEDMPNIVIQSLSYPDEIPPSEDLEIEYTLENIGDETGTENAVELLIDGTVEDSETAITLAPAETETGTLIFDDVAGYDGEELLVAVGDGVGTTDNEASVEPTIDPAIARADGEVDALVYLEPAAVSPLMDADTVIDTLQSQAEATQRAAVSDLEEQGVSVENEFWLVNALAVSYDASELSTERLADAPGVIGIYENAEIEMPEPIIGDSVAEPAIVGDVTYGLDQINAPDVWDEHGATGEDSIVVIQDNGFDVNHEALDVAVDYRLDGSGNIVGDAEVDDDNPHGTHVAGTATGGEDSNGVAIGVAPGAELHAHDIFSEGGVVGAAIGSKEEAVNEGADVVSGSWGSGCNQFFPDPVYNDDQIDPIENARLAGTEVISASGNAGDCVGGFANDFEAFAIGATDDVEDVTSFSSGSLVDKDDGQPNWEDAGGFDSPPAAWPQSWVEPRVAAPGDDVYSAFPFDDYESISGTSMAAPHVAGAIGLIQSATDDEHTGPEIREALKETAWKPDDWVPSGEDVWTNDDSTHDQPGIDSRYGYGIIDTMAAIDYLNDGDVGDDVISFTVALDSFDDAESGQTTIVEASEPEPELSDPAVDGQTFDATITEGEDKDASVVVENIGTAAGSFDIDLEIVNGDTYVQQTQPTGELESGDSETVVFEEVTGDLEPGEYFVYFFADGDSTFADLTVEEAPESQFDVSITDANEPAEGELLELDATIENTGGTSDEQSLMLDAGALGTDEQTVSLDASESTTETFTVGTDAGDAGEYTATLESGDDTDSSTVTVLEPAEFTVEIDEAEDVVRGNDVEVVATIQNVGDVTDEQTVELNVPTIGTDARTIELAGGDATTETFAVPTSDGDTTGTYTISVESEDDDATTDIDILEPPEFTVDIDSVNEPVAGEDIVVDATIENTGEATDEQSVELSVAVLGDNSTSVELDGGESTTETFSVPTNEGDEGGYSLTVATDDDEAEGTVTVIEPAFFAVTIDSATEPVAGENLLVNATIENTGEATDEQTVELSVAGLGTDNRTVELDGDDSVAESFTVSTDEGDDGTYTAVLESEDDTDQTDVTVLKPAEFSVEILGTSTTGSLVDVSYELENIGDVEATQTLTVTVDGAEESTREHTLAGGANETESFEYELEHGDAPEVLFELASEDDSAEQAVSITPAELEFSDIGTNDPVIEGDEFELTLTATNIGEEPADENVELTNFDDSTVDSNAVALTGEESTQMTLVWETEVGDAGSDAVTVDGETAEAQSVPVEILAQAGFAVSIDDLNEPVAGEDIVVNATIENTGDVSDEQSVSLDVEGLGEESTTVELDGGESVTETLTVETTADDAGSYNVTVTTEDNEDESTVTVLEPAEFQITAVSANEPVAGEDIAVTATIENTGDVTDEQSVSLDVDGLGTDSTTVELDGGDVTTETLTVETDEDDAGNYTAAVATDDDNQTTTVTVLEPAAFQITAVTANEPVAGDDIEVTATIENTGDVSDEQSVSLDIAGLGIDSTTVELDGGDATTETLTIETTDGDAGNYTAAVTTDDASQPIDVTVLEPALFEITELTANNPVQGEAIEVTATIENAGEIVDEQTVSLDVDGLGTDSTTVELDGGDATTETLTVETGEDDAGNYTATVTTDDTGETIDVTVTDTIGPRFELGDVTVSDTVAGDALEVSAVIENTGDELGTVTVNASAAAFGTDETAIDVAATETETATLTLATEYYQAGTHDVTVESAGESETESVMVSPPPVSEDADAPTNMGMADGLYEDITGDGNLTIADIQMLFQSLENDEVQQNSQFYDFAGLNPDEVTIFDIQALFNLYAEN